MITIKHREFANTVKTTAHMVLPLTTKKEKAEKQIEELKAEIENLNKLIDSYQDRVKEISGGLTTQELVMRKKDAEGKYIAGFFPNPDYVVFDEEKRVYVIREQESEQLPELPSEIVLEESVLTPED